jgi:hypothetical protein
MTYKVNHSLLLDDVLKCIGARSGGILSGAIDWDMEPDLASKNCSQFVR